MLRNGFLGKPLISSLLCVSTDHTVCFLNNFLEVLEKNKCRLYKKDARSHLDVIHEFVNSWFALCMAQWHSNITKNIKSSSSMTQISQSATYLMRSILACLKVCTAPHTSFLFHPSHSVTHKCTLTLDLKCLKESCACKQVHNRSDPSIVSHSHCAGQQGKKNVLK